MVIYSPREKTGTSHLNKSLKSSLKIKDLKPLNTCKKYFESILLNLPLVKVARTSFLARGVDHHRASRVRNTNDRGARFKTPKTKTNMAARGFFSPRSLLYCWRRNSHIKEALPAGTTKVNTVYLRKIVSGIQCFPNFKGNSIDRAATENVLRTRKT